MTIQFGVTAGVGKCCAPSSASAWLTTSAPVVALMPWSAPPPVDHTRFSAGSAATGPVAPPKVHPRDMGPGGGGGGGGGGLHAARSAASTAATASQPVVRMTSSAPPCFGGRPPGSATFND